MKCTASLAIVAITFLLGAPACGNGDDGVRGTDRASGAGGTGGAPSGNPHPSATGGSSGGASDTRPDASAAPDGSGTGDDAGPLVDAGSEAGTLAPAGPWARNVGMGLVEASQGVFVAIGDKGAVLEPAQRNAPLIEGRPLFVRVHVTAEPGFAARRLQAIVSLQWPGGGRRAIEDTKMITGSSDVEKLETTFTALFPEDAVKPGAQLSVSIYESESVSGPDPSSPPRFPSAGAADLDVKGGPMELDLVMIPATSGAPIADTPERRKNFESVMYAYYPVQKVNIRWHEPLKLAGVFKDKAEPWAMLRDLRMQENAPAYEYYHMLIARRDSAIGGLAGSAVPMDPGVPNGAGRVAWSIAGGDTIDLGAETSAHEIGHNHGRPHSPGCGAGGADTKFPYPMAGIGVNGYDLSKNAFKSKSTYTDLMAYCHPRWVSDYVWNWFEARVRALTALKMAMFSVSGRSVQGFVGDDGSANWGLARGRLVGTAGAATTTRNASLRLADGRVVRAPISVGPLSEDGVREISVNLPDDQEVREATVFVDGRAYTLSGRQLASP